MGREEDEKGMLRDVIEVEAPPPRKKAVAEEEVYSNSSNPRRSMVVW
jgi:hypothetical protein